MQYVDFLSNQTNLPKIQGKFFWSFVCLFSECCLDTRGYVLLPDNLGGTSPPWKIVPTPRKEKKFKSSQNKFLNQTEHKNFIKLNAYLTHLRYVLVLIDEQKLFTSWYNSGEQQSVKFLKINRKFSFNAADRIVTLHC